MGIEEIFRPSDNEIYLRSIRELPDLWMDEYTRVTVCCGKAYAVNPDIAPMVYDGGWVDLAFPDFSNT